MNPRELTIGGQRYRVHFGTNGSIAHIDKWVRKSSGRRDWRWVWPRPRSGETPISRDVRKALALSSAPANRP